MRLRISPTWILLGVVFAAAAVRVAYVWNLSTDRLNWEDEQEYDEIAWRLASTGRFESLPYRATPVLSWFLAAVYRVAGHDYRAARVAQSVVAGATVLAIYAIGASLFTRVTGFVAAIGVAFYPPLIYLSGVFYAEHLYTVLLAVTVLCLVKWWQTKRLIWVVAAGVSLGLGVLCRPVSLGFVPFAAAYVGWTANGRLRWRGLAILLVALSATVGPWTIRNAITFHHFVPVSAGFGMHLWLGNNDVARGDADDRFLILGGKMWQERVNKLPDPEQRKAAWTRKHRFDVAVDRLAVVGSGSSEVNEPVNEFMTVKSPLPLSGSATSGPASYRLDQVKLDRLYAQAAEEWMVYHPVDVLRLSTRRLLVLYSAFTRTGTQSADVSPRNQMIAAISFYPVLALGLIGAVVAWYSQRASIVLHAAIGAGMAFYLVTTACTRFRLPLDPFWILLASVAVTSGREKLRVGVASAWHSAWERVERPASSQWRCADLNSTTARDNTCGETPLVSSHL